MPPIGEAEPAAIGGWANEVEMAIKPRIARCTHVDVLQQREQPIDGGRLGGHPRVEIEAPRYLATPTVCIKLVDSGAVARGGQHKRECGAKIPQRDVQATTQMRQSVERLQTL